MNEWVSRSSALLIKWQACPVSHYGGLQTSLTSTLMFCFYHLNRFKGANVKPRGEAYSAGCLMVISQAEALSWLTGALNGALALKTRCSNWPQHSKTEYLPLICKKCWNENMAAWTVEWQGAISVQQKHAEQVKKSQISSLFFLPWFHSNR